MEALTTKILGDLFNHGYKWLLNLRRAKTERKKESIQALRQVVTASRETAVYIRQLNDNGNRDHNTERHLSLLWTDLGFALEDLGIKKLAKRFQIKGKHWSNPRHYDKEFLDKADISLDKMEKLAEVRIKTIDRFDKPIGHPEIKESDTIRVRIPPPSVEVGCLELKFYFNNDIQPSIILPSPTFIKASISEEEMVYKEYWEWAMHGDEVIGVLECTTTEGLYEKIITIRLTS